MQATKRAQEYTELKAQLSELGITPEMLPKHLLEVYFENEHQLGWHRHRLSAEPNADPDRRAYLERVIADLACMHTILLETMQSPALLKRFVEAGVRN
jgi:hypothetical protein